MRSAPTAGGSSLETRGFSIIRFPALARIEIGDGPVDDDLEYHDLLRVSNERRPCETLVRPVHRRSIPMKRNKGPEYLSF